MNNLDNELFALEEFIILRFKHFIINYEINTIVLIKKH